MMESSFLNDGVTVKKGSFADEKIISYAIYYICYAWLTLFNVDRIEHDGCI